MVNRGLFSTFITRGLPVIAQSEIFLLKGVSFYPSISPFTMREYEGYACKSLLPTNGDGGKSLEEEIILSETGINGPTFSPFIMKGYARHACKPYPFSKGRNML